MDLNLAQAQVWLQLAYRKIWCPACGGVRVEKLGFADAGHRVTHRLVRAFIKQLRFFAYGILNHADCPIGTSRLERINNKIKVIKRKAYGFHD